MHDSTLSKSDAITLAVITADRPDEMAGCLASFAASSHHRRTLVFDDSRNLHEPKIGSCEPRIHRITRSDRRKLAKLLSRQGVCETVAAFCLLGPDGGWFTAGANRNAALIYSAGERILMVDDDTRARIAISPGYSSTIRIAGHDDPTYIRFFGSRQEVLAAAQWTALDVFRETERYLGRSLSDLNPSRAAACDHLRSLLEQDRGIVTVAGFGVAGDSGFYSPAHLLWMASQSTAAALRRSDSLLDLAMSSREVIRMVECPTITHATVCMATAVGLDNRTLLPPFLPGGRNEDGFFGNLLCRIFPEACMAHLPYAVLHQPAAGRSYRRLCADAQTLRISELLILLLSSCPLPPGVHGAKALRVLGNYLKDLGAPRHQFPLAAREIVRWARGGLLEQLDLHDRSEDSQSFKTLLGQLRAKIGELIASKDCWRPIEFSDLTESDAAEATSDFATMTGELLTEWPEIIEAAEYLQRDQIFSILSDSSAPDDVARNNVR